jgi:hypothetical protein
MTRVILYDFKVERRAGLYYSRYEKVLNENGISR